MSSIKVPLCEVQTYMPIADLKLHPDNPRQISKEKLELLKKSIVEKGFYQPILVWSKDNIILSGNHRYLAVKSLMRDGYMDGDDKYSVEFNRGKTTGVLPVVVEDVSDEEARAILFESNNHYAEWVETRLAQALAEAQAAGADVESFGFDAEKVDVLLKSALQDAEEVIDSTRKIDPVDYDDIEGALGEHDEFESLVLQKPIYEQAVEMLSKLAPTVNPEWKKGDALNEAMQALLQFAGDKGIEELWRKKKEDGLVVVPAKAPPPRSFIDEIQASSDREIENITRGFEASHEDALASTARKAIDLALLQMFGGVVSRDESKRMIVDKVTETIKKFNAELSKEIHEELKHTRDKLQAEMREKIKDMREGFMNELKDL